MTNFLYQDLEVVAKLNLLKPIPRYIQEGLAENIILRDYQKAAIQHMITYYETEELSRNKSKHLLFHMATGSGKTVIMAAMILYLYKQGYKNFLFFVNSSNIIEKTIDNFTNRAFPKYLFNPIIEIDGNVVNIKKAENFQGVLDDDITIVFTTIQGLHSNMWNTKENSLSIQDFEDNKIVLISDEAHHINAYTAKGRVDKDEEDNVRTWETTVMNIFHANKDNIMLEFTATIDLKNPYILEKYKDKIIFDYPLSKFRESGYTKELVNLQSYTTPWTRTLQALIVSQYRMKLFQFNGVYVKPVILLKSRTIKESEQFYLDFFENLKTLKISDIEKIRSLNTENAIMTSAFEFFKKNNITDELLIMELINDFSEEHAISMNRDNDLSRERQKLVNTLEEPSNPYRIIFTVDKLNEGWDVLNLFDIVRLYETRQGGPGGSISKFTIREAQLIGRGARYCPFQFNEEQEKFKRKYDLDIDNEYRICETLLYHSKQDSRYIEELRRALKETGLLPDSRTEIKYKLKDSFKRTKLYKEGLVFSNKRVERDRKSVQGIPEKLRTTAIFYDAIEGRSVTTTLFEDVRPKTSTKTKDITTPVKVKDIPTHITLKAIRQFQTLDFNKLLRNFPNLSTILDFIKHPNYLGEIEINIKHPENQKITNDDYYNSLLRLMNEISSYVSKIEITHQGTNEFYPRLIAEVFKDKTRLLLTPVDGGYGEGIPQNAPTIDEKYRLNLSNKDWYAFNDNYGTTEEKSFVKYFDKMVIELNEKYDDVYLIRNERQLAIYSFESGDKFEPDYLLFLIDKNEGNNQYFQIFIEPKGDHLLSNDEWKNKFLLEIEKQAIPYKKFVDDNNYFIWGLPFYNENNTYKEFDAIFREKIIK